MRRRQSTGTAALALVLLALLAGACVNDAGTPPGVSALPPSRGKVDDLTASSCQGSSAAMEYVKVCGPGKAGGTDCKCISRLVMGTDHLGNFWEQSGFPEGSTQTPS